MYILAVVVELYSSKKPYGNKTVLVRKVGVVVLYSSKKPYGNKTQPFLMV